MNESPPISPARMPAATHTPLLGEGPIVRAVLPMLAALPGLGCVVRDEQLRIVWCNAPGSRGLRRLSWSEPSWPTTSPNRPPTSEPNCSGA